MTDMHCHILPCVDDGAGSVEEACSMAWKAWENGTKRIIATPHFCRPDQRRRRSVQEYRRYVYLLQQVSGSWAAGWSCVPVWKYLPRRSCQSCWTGRRC